MTQTKTIGESSRSDSKKGINADAPKILKFLDLASRRTLPRFNLSAATRQVALFFINAFRLDTSLIFQAEASYNSNFAASGRKSSGTFDNPHQGLRDYAMFAGPLFQAGAVISQLCCS